MILELTLFIAQLTTNSSQQNGKGLVDPCTSYYNEMVNITSGNIDVYAEDKNCNEWKVGQWTSFTNREGQPLQIQTVSGDVDFCIQVRLLDL